MKKRFDQSTGNNNFVGMQKPRNPFRDQSFLDYDDYNGYNSYENQEEYLPFNKEELRPVIRDNNYNQGSPNVEKVLLDALSPIVEQWLDENLERIVHKVVKRKLIKKEAEFHQQEREQKFAKPTDMQRKHKVESNSFERRSNKYDRY